MASKPTPSTDRMVGTLRPLRRRHGGVQLGAAARAAESLRSGIAVGLSRRLGNEDAVTDAPWGLWQRDADGQPALVPHGNAALARYAAQLRRRRGGDRPAPARGLPLTTRRAGGTAAGPTSGPGGLARSLVPTDRTERADIAAILRDGRRSSNPGPSPLPLPLPDARRR